MKRKLSIIHPSRSRADIAGVTSMRWILNSDDSENIEYIICLDTSDPKGMDYKEDFHNEFFIKCIKDNKSAIQAINEGAKMATGDIFIIVSDDFNEPPEHWDTLLLNELEGKEDFLVKTPDGLQKTLVTLPIMDSVYYKRFGYVYENSYKHLFCDQEMTAVAIMTGKLIYADVPFIHNHHSTGKFQKDNVSVRSDATWNQGKKVFHERLKKNFGIKNPLVKYSDIVW